MFIDWVTMLENLANSLVSVFNLLMSSAYIIGIGLIITGLMDLKVFGAGRHMSQEPKHSAFLKMAVGILLLYLPTTLQIMTASFFGQGQVLSYETKPGMDLYSAIKVLMQVAGILWFIRGSLMLLHIAEPGRFKNYICLMYIFAGICALNLDYFIGSLTYLLNQIMQIF